MEQWCSAVVNADSYGFGKVLAWQRLCHPEAKPKDLATEKEVSSPRFAEKDPGEQTGTNDEHKE